MWSLQQYKYRFWQTFQKIIKGETSFLCSLENNLIFTFHLDKTKGYVFQLQAF